MGHGYGSSFDAEVAQGEAQAYRAAEVAVSAQIVTATAHLTDRDEISRVAGGLINAELQKAREPGR